MLRWLIRLLVLGLIAGVAVLVASRLANREEDWDDFDDETFEFKETPVEIDVPAEVSAPVAAAPDSVSTAPGHSLQDINGIGPAYEARLQAIGVNTLYDLAGADANSINEQLDVLGGAAAVENWITQAREMTSAGQGGSSNGRGA